MLKWNKGVDRMGRPKGGKNISHSKEEKLRLVKRNLAGESLVSLERETGISNSQIYNWTKKYLEGSSRESERWPK